ncbi:hypothetical protein AKO1_013016, partial [Acrasis kona]
MGSEMLYRFSKIPSFHIAIAQLGSTYLVPQLTFKDLVSKSFAVMTLAQCCETREVIDMIIRDLSSSKSNDLLIKATIHGFMMTRVCDFKS